jgi:hypothetical protein
LVLSGANVNACTPSGASALFIASYTGHAACVQVLLQASADADSKAASHCLECARNRGFSKIAKLLERHPPGCVEGFVYDSAAVFRKWRRRYFFVSVSEGIIICNPSCIVPSVLRDPHARPADAVTLVRARDCCVVQLDNFEGKQCVLKICSSLSSEVGFLLRNATLLVNFVHFDLIN